MLPTSVRSHLIRFRGHAFRSKTESSNNGEEGAAVENSEPWMREPEARAQARSARVSARRGKPVRGENSHRTRAQGLAYPARRPRKSANWSGTPKSLRLTGPLAGTEALRVNRSVHESRKCAQSNRDRIVGPGLLWPSGPCACLTSMRWCRTSCMQARRCALRLQSREAAAGQNQPGGDATAR